MNYFSIVLEQVEIFVVYLLIGIIAVKTNVLNREKLGALSSCVTKVLLPLLIFSNAINGATKEQFLSSTVILLLTAVYYLVLYLVTAALSKLLHLDIQHRNLYRACSMFGNCGFMGIPIISTIYGGEYVLHVSIFMMTFNLSLFSYGVYLLSKDDAKNTAAAAVSEVQAAAPENSGSQKSTGFNVKKLLSPGILSAFLAIGIYLLDIRLPQHAVSLFSTIGVTTTPLAMIVIGSTLAGVKFSTVFTDKELYLFSFLKLLVLPMITFFVLRFFIKDRTLLEISTILSGCPIAGNVSMLCMEYNRDVTLVSKGICISTLLSMISIPIVSALVAIL